MRHALSAVWAILLLTGAGVASDLVFVAPEEGSQVFGVQRVEVATARDGVDRIDFYVDGVLAGAARSRPWQIPFDFGDSGRPRVIAARLWADGYRHHDEVTVRTAAPTLSDTINVDLVEVPVLIRSIRKPGVDDLRVRENGVRQSVADVRDTRGPTSFLFVVDRSSSMRNGKLEAAVGAVASALRQLREGDDARLVLFNHQVAAPVALSASALRSLTDLTPSGGTSLRDALVSVPLRRRTALVVITDGGDRNSGIGADAALQGVARSRVTVYALALGSGNATDFLRDAARATGGRFLHASAESLNASMASVMSEINSRYTVVYQSTNRERGWRSIEIDGKNGVRVDSSRRGYFAE